MLREMPVSRGWTRALRFVVAAGLAAAALLAWASPSSPAERIVIHGAASGSHLKLSVEGEQIVVDGFMSSAAPTGCHFTRERLVAVCPLREASAIELEMGPSGDMVEVLDPLPIPLTIYLGNGSDKFIGNGERDTCYPGGARRNRCIGGAGDDVCITGPRNSDCVGGPGNDYCQHGDGSDGCWGGPGRDVCRMGSGEDGCHGDGGRDRLFGGADPDQLYGGGGFDYCDGGRGWGRSHTCEAGPRR
jgi:RTX calcium-binding nonapeptide repeat (4 copies)